MLFMHCRALQGGDGGMGEIRKTAKNFLAVLV